MYGSRDGGTNIELHRGDNSSEQLWHRNGTPHRVTKSEYMQFF